MGDSPITRTSSASSSSERWTFWGRFLLGFGAMPFVVTGLYRVTHPLLLRSAWAFLIAPGVVAFFAVAVWIAFRRWRGLAAGMALGTVTHLAVVLMILRSAGDPFEKIGGG